MVTATLVKDVDYEVVSTVNATNAGQLRLQSKVKAITAQLRQRL